MNSDPRDDSTPADTAITAALTAWRVGERAAIEKLAARVHDDLRAIARACIGGNSGSTLQATALVNEAWARLLTDPSLEFHDRKHFFALSARIMRNVLVDHARRRRMRPDVERRAAGPEGTDTAPDLDLLALDAALAELANRDERQARIVELRFFGGLEMSQIAEALGVSLPTVERDWRAARAWLGTRIDPEARR